MTETLAVPVDSELLKRLDRLSSRSDRSVSALAAEAVASFVELEEWRFAEALAGAEDADAGRTVDHAEVADWLRSWGKPGEKPAPR